MDEKTEDIFGLGAGDGKVDGFKEVKATEATQEPKEVIETIKESEKARIKMVEAMGDRNESEIGLADDYWKLKKEFHQLLHEGK